MVTPNASAVDPGGGGVTGPGGTDGVPGEDAISWESTRSSATATPGCAASASMARRTNRPAAVSGWRSQVAPTPEAEVA